MIRKNPILATLSTSLMLLLLATTWTNSLVSAEAHTPLLARVVSPQTTTHTPSLSTAPKKSPLTVPNRFVSGPAKTVPTLVDTQTLQQDSTTSVFYSAQQSQQVIANIFGSQAAQAGLNSSLVVQQADQIAQCESLFHAEAVSSTPVDGSYAEGLFQILVPSTWQTTSQAPYSPLDPTANTLAAWEIFSRDGFSWHEWACAAIVGLS